MQKKNVRVIALAFALAAVVGAGIVVAAEDEKDDAPIAQKDLPPAVWKTASAFSDGGAFSKANLSDEDGLKVYEIVFTKGDRKIEVQTTKAGAFVSTEEKINESAAPESVRQRVAKLFKPGTKLKYEKNVIAVYEVATKDDKGHEVEYLVNEAGVAFQELESEHENEHEHEHK